MATGKKGLFDKVKDTVTSIKNNTSKEDISRGWTTAKKYGDKHLGDNQKWNSAKEKGNSLINKYTNGEKDSQSGNNEENK